MDKKTGKLQSLLNAQVGKGGVRNIVTAVQSYDKRFDFVGAAGVANPSTEPGEVDKATNDKPMNPETPYFIASVTKMYTAAIAMQLHSEKKLDLEAPIGSFLPSSLIDGIHVYKGIDYSRQIKIYQLVNQTSGLADYEMDKPRGGKSLFEELKAGHDRSVDTAEAMQSAVLEHVRSADALIMAAAVADFQPIASSSQKIKKEDGLLDLNDDSRKNLLKIKAFAVWPRTYFIQNEKRVVVTDATLDKEGKLKIIPVLKDDKNQNIFVITSLVLYAIFIILPFT